MSYDFIYFIIIIAFKLFWLSFNVSYHVHLHVDVHVLKIIFYHLVKI